MPRVVIALTALFVSSVVRAESPSPAAAEFFEKEVRPLLTERCQGCHGDKKARAGLRLTSRDAVLKGGESGPAAVAGKPDESLLVRAVHYLDALKMPPKEKLKDREVEVLTRWVRLGLPWPEANRSTTVQSTGFRITDEQRRFWSFQPLGRPPVPAVKEGAWPCSDLDRFILARLEAKGLRPAATADRRTLIRRATYDLTGLPPSPEEVEAFVRDDSADAYERLVDRLLASPAYGERWGRHWLDLARYTDSFDARGLGGEMDIADAWRYRDWVVGAFNRDLPYDRFIREQVAGDLQADAFDKGGVIATGFLAIGNWGGGDADKEKLLTDIADDQVDVVSRTFLGLTVACARCHDHKFDPISTADYYGLAGIFFSSHILPNVGPKTNGPPMLRIPLVSPAELARRKEHQQRLTALEKQEKEEREKAYRAFAEARKNEVAKYLLAAHDYQADSGRPPLGEFAQKRNLLPFALGQWVDGLSEDSYRPMSNPVKDVLGKAGLLAWKGQADTPSLLVNTTTQEMAVLTFKLPPRSVAVHPGPTAGVAVGWRSPITGKVRVGGRLADADAVCGDGVAWTVQHRTPSGRVEVASGKFGNGGAQDLASGTGGGRLREVAVREGEWLELTVLPGGTHVCDNTLADWTIATADETKTWNLATDLLDDPHQGNPHRDRHGNAAVWHFLDMAGSRARPAELTRWAASWHSAQAQAGADRAALQRAAARLQESFPAALADGPFWIRDRADEKYLPAEARATLSRLAAEIASLRAHPFPPVEYANGAQEGGVPGSPHAGTHDVRVHIRGRYDRLGSLVPRRFPEVLAGDGQKPLAGGSGRRELAGWMASADNPLTGRVMVNRVWQWHFGEGLVRTPSNFGALGERPTHPDLLDWLARRFIESGWSIKALHRTIMLSAAYQQASEPRPETGKADPDNRLLGRMNRRRLDAESLRDSLLVAAGRLDPRPGGPATRDFNAPRRTLYLMTIRSDRSGYGPLFDSADSTAPVEKRTVSTVAPQALFLLNHPFVLAQARALAARVTAEEKEVPNRIGRLYQLLYGRPATPEEIAVGREFVGTNRDPRKGWEEYSHLLLCANEFMYVD